jgi:hypothetical protein
MTPSERKAALFKKSRPNVRPFSVMDGDKYSRDSGILWAAYQAGSFKIEPGLTQEEFAGKMLETVDSYDKVWIVDDGSKSYAGGEGPVAMVVSKTAGMIVEPNFMFFKWATCKNILRCTVAFLNMVKSSTKTGILLIRADSTRRSVAEHMKKYGLLYFMGKSDGDEYLYSIRGLGSTEK